MVKPKKVKLIILFFLGSGLIIFTYFYIFYGLPIPQDLKNPNYNHLATGIYDRNNRLLYKIFRNQKRTPVKLKNLPAHIKEATIAIEDKNFYHHGGISIVGGVLRAIKDSLFTKKLEGGSTITQQLVKGRLLTPERTIRRKIKEMILALWVEKKYTKEQILEMYLNQVPYGGANYGIEEASRAFFKKPARELTLQEAALLAGLPQAPSLYSPYLNPDRAKKRRNEVLRAMYKQKYIDKKTYEKEARMAINVQPPKTIIKAPHFVFYIKSKLEKEYGKELVEEGGLKVITTLDLSIQEQAEKILKEKLAKLKKKNISNGAVLVTRPPTGEILAMVGSVDFFATASGTFNVTTALRQPGSSIKPINYAIGLDRKLVTPATVFLDIPTCFSSPGQPKPFCPVNYDHAFHGPVQLRFALGNSFNIPAVRMLALNGVENFVASTSAFTITSINDSRRYGLSLTLGGAEVRMTEMAQAFSSFPNEGIPRKLNSILKVTDRNEKTLFEFKDANLVKDVRKPLSYPKFLAIPGKKAISRATAFLISHILLDNNARMAEFGPSSSLVVPGHAVSVKTGTTNDIRDNWTIGFTPNFLTAVWVGNNDNSPMNRYLVSGITGAAPVWNKIMRFILKDQPDLWPIRPNDIVGQQVCTVSGEVVHKTSDGGESCPSRFEYFIKGTEPKNTVSKRFVYVDKDTDKLAKEGDPNTELREKIIIKSALATYCLDCNHEGDKTAFVRLK